MEKFLKSVFLFLLFSMVFYVSLLCLLGDNVLKKANLNFVYKVGSYGHMNTRLKEINDYENIDVLFLGSSHSYRGFDTRIFEKSNISSFNLGSSSQTPIQTEYLLNKYLDKLNPKVIVYEVYAGTFCFDGVESSVDLIANSKNDFETIKMAAKQNNITVYNTLLFGFYKQLLNSNDDFKEPIVKKEDTYIKGGFVQRKMEELNDTKSFPKTNKWQFNEKQFLAFQEILKLIKSKNIKLLLVQSPITSKLYNSYTNNNVFDVRINKFGNYYNFNKLMNLDDKKYFYDYDHLNQKGVELYNKEIIKVVQKNIVNYTNH